MKQIQQDLVSEAYQYNGYDPDIKTKGRLRTLSASDYKTKYHIIKHPALPVTGHNYVDDDKYNSLFGINTKCNCSTLSDRFVFGNE